MEVNDQNLAQVRAVFLQSLNHNNALRQQAEQALQMFEKQTGFPLVLLELISRLSHSQVIEDVTIRQAIAVFFKNLIRKFWVPEEDLKDRAVSEGDRQSIKAYLVDLMCCTSQEVQKQLAEAVSIISTHDFPNKWQDLLPKLVEKLNTPDINVIAGVMLTANSIMKRFRYVFKSDALYAELLYCLTGFQEPLLKTFVATVPLLKSTTDRNLYAALLSTLRLMARIFFSLNWQDIPEFFEDNMNMWMTEFQGLLSRDPPGLLPPQNSAESTLEEDLKAAIIENLILYATKYDELFADLLPQFTQTIWQLLLKCKPTPQYDILVTVSIKFLTSVAAKHMNMHLFNDEALRQIVEQIVVPNLVATEADEELFEYNPLDYIRKDIEGSDQDTRRRCAMDLVRSLLKNFDVKTSSLCVAYIDAMLGQYQQSQDWRAKDAALHLVLAVSVLSSSVTQGAGDLNKHIDILKIFNGHVLPELHDPNVNARPIVKADAIKLICTFRSHFPTPFLLELLPFLIAHLSSQSVVVQTYAAMTIEKFLTTKDKDSPGMPLKLQKENLFNYLNPLFTALFAVLDNPDLPENDYVMKCVMRVLSVVKYDVAAISEVVLTKLTAILERICKNPANPHYNHYLFECVALLVRHSCDSAASSPTAANRSKTAQFEALLFPPFQAILQMDVVEFIPYVFQILAQLLSFKPVNEPLSPAYKSLFPPLLSPPLWERKGNIPALTDLLVVYVYTGMKEILQDGHLGGLLGVFQKLLASRASEVSAMKLLSGILRNCTAADINNNNYLRIIIQLLLERMKANQTPQYSKLFVHSLTVMVTCYGPQVVYGMLESIQAGLTGMIIENIWLRNLEICSRSEDSEVNQMIIGGTMLLTDSPINQSTQAWSVLLKVVVTLLQSSPHRDTIDDDIYADEGNNLEFDSTYSKLAFASYVEPTSQLPANAVAYFAQSLGALCSSKPGQCAPVIQSVFNEAERATLLTILQQNNVALV